MSALAEHLGALDGAVSVNADRSVVIHDAAKLRATVGTLAHASSFGAGEAQAAARWLLWVTAQAAGIQPASIHDLYMARGRGATPNNFTVPAMNLRVLSFDCARAVFRAAQPRQVGAMIFEIARSEIGYTDQRPAEYISSILAAALAEGFTGPLFIQGDHFQVAAKRYASDPDGELKAVRDLTLEALAAGFLNIDIDTSTLVDLSQATLGQQQAVNATLCAQLTHLIRAHEPAGVTVSVGGEIGEVGGKNSTEAELRAFMAEYRVALDSGGDQADAIPGGTPARNGAEPRRTAPVGLSKISIQTGTSHGGVVLPDGTLAQVKVDFDTLEHLSQVAREQYGMAGAVQHGASTLPPNAFSKFPAAGACEVHLATNFQNMAFENMPAELRNEIYAWVEQNKSDQRKADETDDQFIYNNRKHAIGPFKRAMWSLPESVLGPMRAAWEAQFGFLFEQLNVVNTCDLVAKHVKPVPVPHAPPAGVVAGDGDVSDLAD